MSGVMNDIGQWLMHDWFSAPVYVWLILIGLLGGWAR